MRIRSNSIGSKSKLITIHQVPIENQIINLNQEIKYFRKKVKPLAIENSELKERFHHLRFQIEESLEEVISLLSPETQFKAKVKDVNELGQLIKANLEKTHEALSLKEREVQKLHQQLEIEGARVAYMDQQFKNSLEQEKLSMHLLVEEKDSIISHQAEMIREQKEKVLQKEEQIAHLNFRMQNAAHEAKRELAQQIEDLKFTIEQLQGEIDALKESHRAEVQKIQLSAEKEKKILREDLEQTALRNDQKYKNAYLESQTVNERLVHNEGQLRQLRQMNQALEKQIQQLQQKKKHLAEELIEEKKGRGKESKLQEELNQQLKQKQLQVELEVKKQSRLKDQYDQLKRENQELIQNLNQEIGILKQQVNQLNQDVANLQKEKQGLRNHNYEQMQFQRIKYEALLGNPISQEDQRFEMKDQETQFDDTTIKFTLEDYELALSQIWNEKEQLGYEVSQLRQNLQKQAQRLGVQYEGQVRELRSKHKLLLQKQQQDFEVQRQAIIVDTNNRIQIMAQQNSSDLEKLNEAIKDLQSALLKKDGELEEKENMLESFVGQQEDLIKLHKQELEELSVQHMEAQQQLQQELRNSENVVHQLSGTIDELELQIKELGSQKLSLKKMNEELSNSIKLEQLNVMGAKNQLEKKNKEMSIMQEHMGRLNERIKLLSLDVENARQTYNIFTRGGSTASTRTQYEKPQNQSDIKIRKVVNTRLKTSPEKKSRSISNQMLSTVKLGF